MFRIEPKCQIYCAQGIIMEIIPWLVFPQNPLIFIFSSSKLYGSKKVLLSLHVYNSVFVPRFTLFKRFYLTKGGLFKTTKRLECSVKKLNRWRDHFNPFVKIHLERIWSVSSQACTHVIMMAAIKSLLWLKGEFFGNFIFFKIS